MSEEKLPQGAIMKAGRGGFADGWFHEEADGSTRFAIRAKSHLHSENSRFQKIDVYDTDFFGRFLTLDDLVMLTERDEYVYHEMLIHVPLCSIPEPRAVLIVGGGDGGCIREALKHPSVERIVQCEIDERVTRVCEEYFPWVKQAIADPRVELVFDDGVSYVEQHREEFDLVVIDSTDPIGAAVGLFTREFYSKAAQALVAGGVLVAQTESPHWNPDTVGAIYDQLGQAFDHAVPYLGFIPTYPSGMWSWAYASNHREHDTFFDSERAERLGRECKYYNPDLQRGAFALPNFVKRALAGGGAYGSFQSLVETGP